ncbi:MULTISPECIES: hypothetical protein [unclassified Methylophaga]|jgi:hypothetical protein|uniref:hypothetical protein n=1 Tax=unclassified Methylophaga TaxID=2629249 RepID=UPI000C58DCD0|nr:MULTISPECIES: hypothetical protein [unclassified Methylophaga]MAL48888.1 hypothetical protein [Methylophaga sp.]MAM27584.1 hypothetical protein [Flavobacteriaceae bacterium]MBP40703.1 hypothetical protein [Aequorivita sp.]|tara:strand:- start:16295 stop:17041 length:747 start_codon:yes stop_codon:yes gene_type:complete
MEKYSRNILLLTATISPKTNQPSLIITDEKERLFQYSQALEYYIHAKASGDIDAIVFVDNSGYDVSDLRQKYGRDDVEIISFYGLDYPVEYHRGYGEMTLIVKAYEHSKLLQSVSKHGHVWKITGRYKIKNINSVIRFSDSNFDVLCKLNKGWMAMEIFSWSQKGFSELIRSLPEHLKSRMPPEIIIPRLLIEKKTTILVSKAIYPAYISGVRGSDGKSFIGRFGVIRHALAVLMFWPKKTIMGIFQK